MAEPVKVTLELDLSPADVERYTERECRNLLTFIASQVEHVRFQKRMEEEFDDGA
jgi:hypothetical protein